MTASDPRLRDQLLAAGLANQRRRAFAAAEQCYKLVLTQRPRDPEALYRMGVLALQCANAAGAVHYLRQAQAVRELDADGWYNLGMAYTLDYAFAEARSAFENALARDAAHASAAISLGNIHKLLGQPVESAQAYRQAVASPQIGATLFSQLLVGLHTNPAVAADELFELHCEWARRHARPHYPDAPRFANAPDPQRRLKVGLVSPKFTADIVGHFLRTVVRPLAAMTDLYLYHAGTARDWVTAELQQAPVQWRSIAELDDAAAAQRIVADGIDVLVDLAGHAPGNRLQLFARRPAPVQVTWLDYFDTTAIATMDALVTDPVSTPPDLVSRGAQRFTEHLVYLPHARLCYAPPPFAPVEAPLPAQRTGRITFGCFGRADKMLPEVIALWSRVLAAVPGSVLVLKNDACDVAPVRERMLASFAAGGIDAGRIVFRGPSAHAEMLAEYAAIDIALDTFPYNGGATTCDALWMGIPVITLAGETMIARQGAALLTAAGHPEWIAADPAACVRIARDLAADVPALAATRGTLRGELARSPLCDADAFARDLHAALRQAWVRWCEERAPVESLVPHSAAEVAR